MAKPTVITPGSISKIASSIWLVSKTPGNKQDVPKARDFMRVHRQYMVNLDYIQKLVKGAGMYLLLINGVSIPVAHQQKDRLMERVG